MKYRALSRTFVEHQLYEAGAEFEYDGPKSTQWEALEEVAPEPALLVKGRKKAKADDDGQSLV
jgi:hypothetical protein